MLKSIAIGSAVGALVCLGLAQVSDPAFLGVTSEPSSVLFYGVTGLLAGALGLVALGSGSLSVVRRAKAGQERTTGRKMIALAARIVLGLVLLGGVLGLAALGYRLSVR
ncbi:MAG: hypothetical protein ACREOC_16275 [Gemmatimonadales bacterium]